MRETVASSLLAVVLCSLGISIPLSSAEPFLPDRMSFAFKSSLLQLSYRFDNDVSLKLLFKGRGGHEESTTAQVLTRGVSNEASTLDLDDIETISDVLTDESSVPYNFSLFQKGDGSETDPDGIPGRFLRMQKNNRPKAKAALEHTLAWRKQHDVDTILSRPHPKYDICKRVLPHYFAGRDPTGHVIFVQRPGKIQVEVGHVNNVTTDDLLMHYVYILEYCWNEIEPRPDQTMTSVIDLGGLHLPSMRKMFHFVKEFVHMMSQNYPQRSYKTLLINAPRWFGATYRLIAPILRESTRSKIQILSGGKRQREALEEYLGHFAPKELLDGDDTSEGADEHTGPNSPMEQMLRAFVSSLVCVRVYSRFVCV